MRHAVIGDVGGHLGALEAELVRLGADPATGSLPDDLTIIQLGDLVHRGPHSELVVDLVDRFLANSGGRWIQLVGNHEAQYLRHPAFSWRDWIAPEAQRVLRGWWVRQEMIAAAVVPSPAGEVLVTHAGITEEFWRRDLGSAQTATAAAAILNEMAAHGDNNLFRAGVMLGGGKPNHRAGPLWAQASQELLGSWHERRLPFSQVHGHSSAYDWAAQAWRPGSPVATTTLDPASCHETTHFDGGWIIGIDPGHAELPQPNWHAWIAPAPSR